MFALLGGGILGCGSGADSRSGASADAGMPSRADAGTSSFADAGIQLPTEAAISDSATLCGTSPAPVLAFWKGPSVYLLHADGTIRPAHTAVAQDPRQQPDGVYNSLFSEGRYIAGSAVFNPMVEGGPSSAERFVLDRNGTTLWQAYTSQPGIDTFVGRDGTAVFTESDSALAGGNMGIANSSVLVERTGTNWPFPGLVVLGPPDDNGVALAENIVDRTLGWVRAGDTTLEPLQTPLTLPPPAQVITNVGSVWAGPRFLIDGTAADGKHIVSALPGDERPVTFQGASVDIATLAVPGSLWPPQNLSNWVLATDATNDWRVDVSGAAATSVSVSVPTGLRIAATWTGPEIDDSGQVLEFFRDDNAGGIYVSADGSGNWTRIGHPVANVKVVGLDSRSGTYQIEASDSAYVGETWGGASPPSDALGVSTQIVRPADGSLTVVPGGGTALLSSDGLCAAWWGGAPALTILDVPSGRITPFDQAGPPDTALGLSVWVEAQ